MKYPALRFISKVYKATAYIILFASVIGSFASPIKKVDEALTLGLDWNDFIWQSDVMMFFGILLGGSLVALVTLAFSELLKLFIDIESNTSKTEQ